MSYNVKEFRGEAHRPLRCTDGGQATLQYLAQTLPATFAERNVPAKIRTDTAKSGGLFGSQVPMLVISHPNPPSHYKRLCGCVFHAARDLYLNPQNHRSTA